MKNFCISLRTVKRFISGKVILEFNNYKHTTTKTAIADQNSNFYEDKRKFIWSSLNCEKWSIILDCVLITDISGNPQLLIVSDDIHKVAIKHFQNVVSPNRSLFKTFFDLPEWWKNRYTSLNLIDPDIYLTVMTSITKNELWAIINVSLHHKAFGLSFIPYEWFRLLFSKKILYLCKLMNSYLAFSDIPEDWWLASIILIPKLHEFECLLKNTCPIMVAVTYKQQ